MALKETALSILIKAKDLASAPLAKFRGGVSDTDKQVDELGKQSDSSGKKVDKLGDSIDKTGTLAGKAKAGMSVLTGSIVALAGTYLSINALKNALSGIINTGAQFEQLRTQISTLMGSIEAGEKATAWIKRFASTTPASLEGVTQGFIKLKAFGIDPMNGSYQAIVDQTSKLGFTQEKMEGIILAVGQAWTKQKLQGEEALQLIERGVPVWDLLANATGRTAVELQNMATKGQLGRKEISLLIDEMGKASAGAAADQMNIWNGMISNLKDQWTNFVSQIADAGIFEYVKQQLTSLLTTVGELAKDGTLQAWAKSVSNALVSLLQTIKGVASAIYAWRDAIKVLVAALATVKIVQLVSGVLNYSRAALTAAKSTGILATATELLGNKSAIATGKVKGLSSAILLRAGVMGGALAALVLSIKKVATTLNDADLADDRYRNKVLKSALEYRKAGTEYAKYAGIYVASTEEMGRKDEEALAAYKQKLEGARTYYEGIVKQQEALAKVGQTDAGELNYAKERLAAITTALGNYAEAVKLASTRSEQLDNENSNRLIEQTTQLLEDQTAEELKLKIAQEQAAQTVVEKTQAVLKAKPGTDEYRAAMQELTLAVIAQKERQKEMAEQANATGKALENMTQKEVAKYVKKLNTDLDELESKFEKGKITVKLYSEEKEKLTKAIAEAEKYLKEETDETNTNTKAFEENAAAIARLNQARNAFGEDSPQFVKAQAGIRAQMQDVATEMGKQKSVLENLGEQYRNGIISQDEFGAKAALLRPTIQQLSDEYNTLAASINEMADAQEKAADRNKRMADEAIDREEKREEKRQRQQKSHSIFIQNLDHESDSLYELNQRNEQLNKTINLSYMARSRVFRKIAEGVRNLAQHEQAVISDTKRLHQLNETMATGAYSADDLTEAMRWATSSTRTLDQSTLNNLIGSIRSAQDEMRAFREEAEDAKRAVEQELAEAQGDYSRATNARFDSRAADIQRKLDEAKTLSDQKAIADLQAALQTLNKLRTVELQNAREREQQQSSANTPSRTVRLALDTNGQTVGGDFDSDEQARAFVNAVKNHRWNSA